MESIDYHKEWNIKLCANSAEEAAALLKKISEIFNKVEEEIYYKDELGYFESKKSIMR